jgi:hypothetical protein
MTGTQNPSQSSPLAPAIGSVRIVADTAAVFAGLELRIGVTAVDRSGIHVSTDAAVLTSSNPAVATVSLGTPIPMIDPATERRWTELASLVHLFAPGTAILRVTLGDTSDSLVVHVRPVATSAALVVDSFSVVEYRVSCAWACPYLAYAPLLKLREPTGNSVAEVVSVEFRLGTQSTGVCRGSVVYTPGESAHVNGIYDYLWSNDLILVSIDGQPIPGDEAFAHVVVRDAHGVYGQLDAIGPVQRMVANPVFPQPSGSGWDCR